MLCKPGASGISLMNAPGIKKTSVDWQFSVPKEVSDTLIAIIV